jgi:ubiquitin-protein ligase
MASGPATRRLLTELQELKSDPETLFLVDMDEENILSWYVILNGPPDSPYAGGCFNVS